MSEVLKTGTQMIRNIRKNTSRKTLQALQPSADDYNLLVPSPSMLHRAGKPGNSQIVCHDCATEALQEHEKHVLISQEVAKSVEDTFIVPANPTLEKENALVARRSKRKNADVGELSKMEPSKEDVVPTTSKTQKSKSSKALKSKKAVAKKSGKKLLPDVNQPSLDSFVSAPSASNKQGESSESIDNSVANADFSVCVRENVSEEVDLLTSDAPSLIYWREIAEQRRIALEKTLYENAQLVDQIQVLECENGQLKSALKECENLIQLVNASL